VSKRRLTGFVALLLLSAAGARALTVDELIAKHIQARGGLVKLRAVQSLRLSGRMLSGDGGSSMELSFVQIVKRPGQIRQEVGMQGLTAISAFDGSLGWQIQPFSGRLDPEKLSADDAKGFRIFADLDGPLVDYAAKGHNVEYLGTEDVDGTEAHKIRVTYRDGDSLTVYLDPDYFLQIRTIVQMRVRGVDYTEEEDWGNYEQINGVMIPFSFETGLKGQPKTTKVVYEKAEINPALDSKLFSFPAPPASAGK